MPDTTPDSMEDLSEFPVCLTERGVSTKGRVLEYLDSDLNLVLKPGDTLPPAYSPSGSITSIVRVVPKSKTMLPLPLKRCLTAITEATLSDER